MIITGTTFEAVRKFEYCTYNRGQTEDEYRARAALVLGQAFRIDNIDPADLVVRSEAPHRSVFGWAPGPGPAEMLGGPVDGLVITRHDPELGLIMRVQQQDGSVAAVRHRLYGWNTRSRHYLYTPEWS